MLDDLAQKVVKALEVAGTHSPEDIERALDSGEMQQWVRDDTVVVTHISIFPQLKACDVVLAAGEFQTAWDLVNEEVEPWARQMGCNRMVGRGRLGWSKGLKDHGYDLKWIVASKELN